MSMPRRQPAPDPPEQAPVCDPKSEVPHVWVRLSPAEPTEVYETYWRFAAERQAIFFRRLAGLPGPWTSDPILARYKFTNVYRASDRVSQYLIRHVIYRGKQEPAEIFFRTILFKLFNRIDTWERLETAFGEVTYTGYKFEHYDRVLTSAMDKGERIYSAAYIMPAEVFERLRSYPSIGGFLAYQFATDLNYSPLINFSEREFVVPGPGALNGIRKCFRSLGGLSDVEMIRVMADRQEEAFRDLGLSFPTLWGRPLQLIDCQNLFCEVDKYARVRHPDVRGATGRTRIKQHFAPALERLSVWYPPKWGLNERIVEAPMGHPSYDLLGAQGTAREQSGR